MDEPEAAFKIAKGWARTIAGVRDPMLQIGWVRAQLTRVGVARAADVLTVVLARAEQRDKAFEILLLRISLALADAALVRERDAIARIAEARGQTALARFLGIDLTPAPQASGLDAAVDEPQRVTASAGEKGRPLALGERKSLARRRDRNLLARVLRDPHPDVIRILLDNPALTEADVVRLCARRPIAPEVLAQVFRHPRWVLRYRVRRALVLNPHTPTELALQLLPHLTPADLKELARASDVSERVREACSVTPGARPPLH